MKRIITVLFFVIGLFFQSNAQVLPSQFKTIDSLKRLIKTAKHDTVRVRALLHWDEIIYISDPNLDFEINQRVEKICVNNLKKKLSKAQKNWFEIRYCECLNNLGLIYRDLGNYTKAIDYYNRSLAIGQELNSKEHISNSYNNIGIVYIDTKQPKKAIDYLKRSLKIAQEIGDSGGVASSYNNIGIIYNDNKEYEKSFEYHTKSLEIREKIHDKSGISASLLNLGLYYQNKKQYDLAVEYFMKGLHAAEEINNQKSVASAMAYLGAVYEDKGNKELAIKYYISTITNAQESGEAQSLVKASLSLFSLYEKMGIDKKALEVYKIYIEIRDSLNTANSQKEALRLEFKHEYEKKAAADSVHNIAEKKLTSAKLRQGQIQRTALYIILALAILFGAFVFSRLRITRRQKSTIEEQKRMVEQQKDIVEEQKHMVEEKQREVMDSIHYAKRIQQALLPSEKYVDRNLNKLNKK